MKYQTDKLSSWLCILSIIANMAYFVSIYTNRSIDPDWVTGADVLINIIFMMVVFLASEKLKIYSKNWNIIVLIISAFQALRIFWLPSHYKGLEMLVGGRYIFAVVCLMVSTVMLFAGGINATINSRILSKTDGNTFIGG
jgi:hypothetical protein